MSRSTILPLCALALFGSGCNAEFLDGFSGMYFVKLNSEPAQVAADVSKIATALDLDVIHVFDSASEGFSVRLPHLFIEDIEKIEGVEYVLGDDNAERIPPEEEPDEVFDEPSLTIGDGETPESILRIGGPFLGGIDLSAVHVAVIDTGIDASHPDLNVVGEFDVVAQSGAGRAAPGSDPNGHGTHCAGTIGARADGSGVVGVAPGVPLHAVRVLGADGSGYWSDIVAGVEYVLEHPEIKVVSMSLGGPAMDGNDPLMDAIDRLVASDVVVVIAAGNSADDTQFYAPAGYDLGLVVSAYDASNASDNGFAWFSNYGDEVDIAAPGVSILSTWPGGGYTELDGTSMATPAVAGAAAVYRALDPSAGAIQVMNQILDSAEQGYAGQQGKHTEPLLDAEALFAAAE
jgi:subtilisin family serine protease